MEGLFQPFLWKGGMDISGYDLLKWTIIKKPIEGLGIINVQLKNQAVLAKWVWRFHNKRDALWRKVIKTKYGSTLMDLKLGKKLIHSSHGPRRFIIRQQNLIYSRIRCAVNNLDYKDFVACFKQGFPLASLGQDLRGMEEFFRTLSLPLIVLWT